MAPPHADRLADLFKLHTLLLWICVVKSHDQLPLKGELIVLVQESCLGMANMQVPMYREGGGAPDGHMTFVGGGGCVNLPRGFRWEASHHFPHLCPRQLHELANIST